MPPGDRALLLRLALALTLALPAPGLSAEHWAAYTDRGQNAIVLEAMGGELGEALQAAQALGRREDPYVSDILSGLLALGRELPALFLLRAVFPPEAEPALLAGRLAANRAGLDELADGLPGFGLALRREAVRLLRQAGQRSYDGAVLAQLGWLEQRLRAQGGRAGAELAELALEVLGYAGASGNPVFLDPVLRLRAVSREAPVSRLAAVVAGRLARTASGNPAGW